MKGDFSRRTFEKNKHYSGVLMQQGRVQLDADWNEQQSINRHHMVTRNRDIVGICGAPWDFSGFEITFPGDEEMKIGEGRYYVDGILCENEKAITYMEQPDLPDPPKATPLMKRHRASVGLVYLDVWHRHITALDDPHIREKALGGSDTATRAKTIWQVKILPLPSVRIGDPAQLARQIAKLKKIEARRGVPSSTKPREIQNLPEMVEIRGRIMQDLGSLRCAGLRDWEAMTASSTGTLNVRTRPATEDTQCNLPPKAGYQGLENELYRVEIHHGGPQGKATFKWSRFNGSVVTQIEGFQGTKVTVCDVGGNLAERFSAGQWAEITDDGTDLRGEPGQFVQITCVDPGENVVELKEAPMPINLDLHPKLRRWDQSGEHATRNGIRTEPGWLALEHGIEIRFSEGIYRTGDYWLIPARVNMGIEWPPVNDPGAEPAPQLPLGIQHQYCPLALFLCTHKQLHLLEDCRRLFVPVTQIINLICVGGNAQTAKPGEELPFPLEAGVAMGQRPVAGATVRFQVTKGSGQLLGTDSSGRVLTGDDGIASCRWVLGDDTESQQVEAVLLDPCTDTDHLHVPIRYSATVDHALASLEKRIQDIEKRLLERIPKQPH